MPTVFFPCLQAAGDAEARGLGVHTQDKDAAAAAVRDLLSADGESDGVQVWGAAQQSVASRVGRERVCWGRPCCATCCLPATRTAQPLLPRPLTLECTCLPALPMAEFDAQGLVARVGKGKQVDAIVEAVNSGSTLRVTLLPELQSATVMVAGVQCPSMGRRPPPTAAVPPAAAAEGEAAPAAAGPAPGSAASLVAAGTPAASDAGPEPFAREARYFTEVRTLNKEVKITLQGVSQVSRRLEWLGCMVLGLLRHQVLPACFMTAVLWWSDCPAPACSPLAVWRAGGQRAVPAAAWRTGAGASTCRRQRRCRRCAR